MAPKKVPSPTTSTTYEEFKSDLQKLGISLSPTIDSSVSSPITSTKFMELNYRWIQTETWSSTKMLITAGQLRAGLSFPLYDPKNPFFYEILVKLQRGVYQLSGNAIRLANEFVRRSNGDTSPISFLRITTLNLSLGTTPARI